MMKSLMPALASLALVTAFAMPAVQAFAKQAEPQVIELQDGTKIKVEGENAAVIENDGSTTPAPDGTHVAKDGTSFTTKAGKVVDQKATY